MKDPYANKPWLKWYDSRVSRKLKYPSISVVGFIEKTMGQYPDRIAVHYMDTSFTFKELNTYANKFANFLYKAGLKKGDVVGVNGLNIPAFYIAILGIQKAGCIMNGVSPLLTPSELEYQLNDAGAKLLLTMDLFWGNVKQVINKTSVKTVLIAGLFDFLPNATEIPDATLQEIPEIKMFRFTDIMRDTPGDVLKVKIDPADICLLQYTGGTTGRAKGAALTHNNIVHHIVQWSNWTDALTAEELLVCPFPLFHLAGLFNALFAYAKATTQVAVPNPRDLDFMVAAIKKYKPSYLAGVPTIYLELIKKPEFRELDFSGIKGWLSAAAPFPAEYIKEFEEIVGDGKLMEVYGMTETSPLMTGQPPNKTKAGSIGVPITDTDIKIVDPITKEPVPLGEVGEIVARGPQVFTKGYYNKPEETANTLRKGWIYTGDLAKMDEDGFIFIVDRLKDMVIVSGYKVFTRELDDVIMEHPDVEMAASIGIPDLKRPGSEHVASAVVLKPGIEKSDAEKEKLIAYLKEKVAPYKVPKVIEFMDQLPTSAVGKVLKKDLRTIMHKAT